MNKKQLGIVVWALFASFSLSAQTYLYVDTHGDDSNKGTIQSPFLTVEKAVEQARQIPHEAVLFYVRALIVCNGLFL